MLTDNDLGKIKTLVETVIEEKLWPIKKELVGIDSVIEKKLLPIKKDLKVLKKDMRYLKKTVSIIAKNYDEGDVALGKRVTRIEKHLHLPQEI